MLDIDLLLFFVVLFKYEGYSCNNVSAVMVKIEVGCGFLGFVFFFCMCVCWVVIGGFL